MIFKPTIVLNSVLEITPTLLKKYGIRGLILDLDNTLTTHNNKNPGFGVLDWIAFMEDTKIPMIILSNNKHDRVKPFSEMLGLGFISNGKKPLSFGINRACKELGLPFSEVAVVGDQLFTDILGANIKKMVGIFVFPLEPEKGVLFSLKRLAERPFLPKRG